MRDYELSTKEIRKLERTHRSLRDKRQADRVKAVMALAKGWSAAQIAEILLFDEKTSRHYFDRYQQGGMEALRDDNYTGAEPKLDGHQMSELAGYLEEHLLPDAKSVIAYIQAVSQLVYILFLSWPTQPSYKFNLFVADILVLLLVFLSKPRPFQVKRYSYTLFQWASWVIRPETPTRVIIRAILKQLVKREASAWTPSKPRKRKASIFKFRLMWPKGSSTFCLRRAYIFCESGVSY